MKVSKVIQCLYIAAIITTNVKAEPDTDNDLGLIYGTQQMQSIATGHPLPQSLSPSVTSVMTSKDIEQIGARRLNDVLEYLPGVHVSSARAGNSVIGFRGIYSETNSQVLILINGIPLRNTTIGGKPYAWNMPVKNISHIEVIRGPGSMLYGGDATTGVINVVLKTGKELKGGDTGGFVGNQDTYEGWAEYGDQNSDFEYSLAVQGGTTNVKQGKIQQDAQTTLDNLFGSHVSNAPGFTNNGRDDIDARIDLGYKDWAKLRAGYQRFNHVQTGEGAALALDNTGASDTDVYNVDLSINNKITEDLDFKSTFYYLGQNTNWNFNLLPAGTLGGLLPEGAKSVTANDQNATGITTQFNYEGIKKHNLTVGTGYIYNWVSKISNKINYLVTPGFIQQIPLTEVSAFGVDPVTLSKDRSNYYALFQDEWNFATDFYLTTGLRYDYYSDVSGGLSPRASLVWNTNNNLTTKLLYSRAFRPPSFLEKNQPAVPGTTIQSEIMDTIEFQVENRWSPALMTSTNLYWFSLNNLITSTSNSSLTSVGSVSPNPVAFSNAGTINGLGVEAEGRYSFNDTLNLAVNYSYHGVGNSNNTGLLPGHMAKALLNWEFVKNWSIGTQLNWIGERKRPANDPRPDLGGYFVAGMTLSTQIAKPVQLTFRVNNLFDSTIKEPSLNPTLLPGDVPVLDRSFLGQIKWTF